VRCDLGQRHVAEPEGVCGAVGVLDDGAHQGLFSSGAGTREALGLRCMLTT
jgi:hypothetical protein